jgi:quercetin dioxygenase-like cupin family protein
MHAALFTRGPLHLGDVPEGRIDPPASSTVETGIEGIGEAHRAGPTPEETTMQITRNSLDTTPGPGDWFTGAVYIDAIASPSEPSRLAAALVSFTPGARTAWHTHPLGQTIYVTKGVGLCQRRGDPIEVIRPGDRVFFEPGEDHWHGAAPNRLMTHIAMQEADDDGSPVTWGEHVTDEEYGAAPAT